MAEESEKKLSSKITGLKFMQRKQERSQRALLEKERERELRESQWVLAAGQEDHSDVIVEDYHAEPFKAGRRSYGGFNPLVEKLTQEVRSELDRARGGRDESLSANNMANRYTKYVKEGQTSRKRKVKSENSVTIIDDDDDEDNPRSRKERRTDDEPPPLERPPEPSATTPRSLNNSDQNNSDQNNSDHANSNSHEPPRWGHGGGERGRGGFRGGRGGMQRPQSFPGSERRGRDGGAGRGDGGDRGRGRGRGGRGRMDGQFSRGRGGRDFRGGSGRGGRGGRGGESGRGGFRRPVGDGL